jgi:glycosyltransferase involved in cell wall biosynthesis
MDGKNPSSCALLIRDWYRYSDHKRLNIMTCGLKKPEPAAKIYEEEGMKVFFLGKGKYSFGNIEGLINLIEKEKIDLLHLHGYSSANFGRLAARKKGIPNIIHEHAIMKILPHQYLADFVLKHKTDAAVAVSNAVKHFMIHGRHIPSEKIRVIWNGIHLSSFKKSDKRKIDKLRNELSISKNHFVLGTVTRFREEKGNEFLLKAIPKVIERFPNSRFFIAGDGPLRDRLNELKDNLELNNHVTFLGFRNDVVDLMSLFDIVVIPSITEGFGLAMAEAMAIGKPIVATEVGGLLELGKDKQSALFVPPANPEALANGIIKLLEAPQLCKKLAVSAQKASQDFGIKNNINLLQNMYLDLLSNNKKSGK